MPKRQTGTYEVTTTTGEPVKAFVPAALPPKGPPLAVEGALLDRLCAAETALARLNSQARWSRPSRTRSKRSLRR